MPCIVAAGVDGPRNGSIGCGGLNNLKKAFTSSLSSVPFGKDNGLGGLKKAFASGLSSPLPQGKDRGSGGIKKALTAGLSFPATQGNDGGFGGLKKALTSRLSTPHSPRSDSDREVSRARSWEVGKARSWELGKPRSWRSSSKGSSTCEGSDASEEKPTAATSLDRIVKTLAAKPWPAGRFEHIHKLQDAVRNKGSVELMFDKGGFGKVAVKRMPNDWMKTNAAAFATVSGAASEQPWLDVAIVQWLNSQQFPYSCMLHGVFQDDNLTYVVFELATEGDLLRWCQELPEQGNAREEAVRPVMHRTCSAVAWLHDLGIAHCDLSLENVLLTKGEWEGREGELKVKLIDFGMATTQRLLRNQARGKPSYQAPEMHIENIPYDPSVSDVFALGVILFCLVTQDYPWMSTVPGMCQFWHLVSVRSLRVLLGRRKPRNATQGQFLSEVLSASLIELLEGMLSVKPGNRVHLGERIWSDDTVIHKKSDRSKTSVWELSWMTAFSL